MKNNALKILIIIIGVGLCMWLVYNVYNIKQRLFELQQDVNAIGQYSSSSIETEYTQAMEFLENETVKFREFVENQQNFLMQLIGIIGTLAIGVLAFLGIEGRKDISNIIQKQYTKQIEKELSDFVGGYDRVVYLQNCVKRQQQAESKKILFLLQNEEYEGLMKVYEELKDGGFKVKKKKVGSEIRDREISGWVEDNDIIIYEVGECETEKTPSREKITFIPG